MKLPNVSNANVDSSAAAAAYVAAPCQHASALHSHQHTKDYEQRCPNMAHGKPKISHFSALTLGGLARKDVVVGLVCEAGGEIGLCSCAEGPAEDDLIEESEHGWKCGTKSVRNRTNSCSENNKSWSQKNEFFFSPFLFFSFRFID